MINFKRFQIIFIFLFCFGFFVGEQSFAYENMAEGNQEASGHMNTQVTKISPDKAEGLFVEHAKNIDSTEIKSLPLQDRGRIKPFESLARESLLYVMGKYQMWGLNSTQMYLALLTFEHAHSLKLINIRSPKLRESLGFTTADRWVSLNEIMISGLEQMATPLYAKQENNKRLLTPQENEVLELANQFFLLSSITSGQQFLSAVNPSTGPAEEAYIGEVKSYISALAKQEYLHANGQVARIQEMASQQSFPEGIAWQLDNIGLEVMYNKVQPFFLVAIFYFLIAILLLFEKTRKRLNRKNLAIMLAVPLVIHTLGFIIRVKITGFAPVTNMYGTMIWVAYGVALFSFLLYWLYQNGVLLGWMLMGASALLYITHAMPLILSPDMDPIVAVLRSNLWLSIHVLTIVISYAAFTISMLIGNVVLIKGILNKLTPQFLREYSHHCYRIIQLGVFLLAMGIILGGIWADYSWGRFWGWDPKETWSLIALLGYVILLHARHIGWIQHYGLVAGSSMAYLLVVMAWYGVNFILATGLHSYGFSSGGQTFVFSFVGVQLVIFLLGVGTHYLRNQKKLGAV